MIFVRLDSTVRLTSNTGENDIYFDLVSIDSSDWIGEEGGAPPAGGITTQASAYMRSYRKNNDVWIGMT
jgi:hypothetical protein